MVSKWPVIATRYPLFNVSDFLLLLSIGFHLVDLVFFLRLDVCGIIAGVVCQLFLQCEIHDVGADGIHKVLRVGGYDEDMVVRR